MNHALASFYAKLIVLGSLNFLQCICVCVSVWSKWLPNQKQKQQWTTGRAAAAVVATTQWLVIEVNVVK